MDLNGKRRGMGPPLAYLLSWEEQSLDYLLGMGDLIKLLIEGGEEG